MSASAGPAGPRRLRQGKRRPSVPTGRREPKRPLRRAAAARAAAGPGLRGSTPRVDLLADPRAPGIPPKRANISSSRNCAYARRSGSASVRIAGPGSCRPPATRSCRRRPPDDGPRKTAWSPGKSARRLSRSDWSGYRRSGFRDWVCAIGSAVSDPPPRCSPKLGGALQQARVNVEDVARIGLASRRLAQSAAPARDGGGVLGQVVDDDQGMAAAVAEILRHREARVRGEPLQPRRAVSRRRPRRSIVSIAP